MRDGQGQNHPTQTILFQTGTGEDFRQVIYTAVSSLDHMVIRTETSEQEQTWYGDSYERHTFVEYSVDYPEPSRPSFGIHLSHDYSEQGRFFPTDENENATPDEHSERASLLTASARNICQGDGGVPVKRVRTQSLRSGAVR